MVYKAKFDIKFLLIAIASAIGACIGGIDIKNFFTTIKINSKDIISITEKYRIFSIYAPANDQIGLIIKNDKTIWISPKEKSKFIETVNEIIKNN